MLKLNAGFSRKVGEPNYGSRGASVNVELEVESGLAANPEGLLARLRGLFDLARRSVEQELAGASPAEPARPAAAGGYPAPPQGAPYPAAPNGQAAPAQGAPRAAYGNGARRATASQLRAIRAICHRQKLDPERFANGRYPVHALEELTVPEASALIDELKAAGTNGGGA